MAVIRSYRLLVAVATAVSLLAIGYVWGTTTSSSGKVNSFDAVHILSGTNDCITAITDFDDFVDMPGVVQDLSGTGPFVVMFQGQFYDPFINGGNGPGSRVAIAAEIDGIQVGSFFAIGNQLEATGSSMQTFGFNSASGPLNKGPHELKVRWRVTPAGANACVEERSLIVLKPTQ